MIKCSKCNRSLEEIDDLEVAVGLMKKYDNCPFCNHEFDGKPKKILVKSNGYDQSPNSSPLK